MINQKFLENYESCVESKIDFSSLILLDNDYITNWKWDFGDSVFLQI